MPNSIFFDFRYLFFSFFLSLLAFSIFFLLSRLPFQVKVCVFTILSSSLQLVCRHSLCRANRLARFISHFRWMAQCFSTAWVMIHARVLGGTTYSNKSNEKKIYAKMLCCCQVKTISRILLRATLDSSRKRKKKKNKTNRK